MAKRLSLKRLLEARKTRVSLGQEGRIGKISSIQLKIRPPVRPKSTFISMTKSIVSPEIKAQIRERVRRRRK